MGQQGVCPLEDHLGQCPGATDRIGRGGPVARIIEFSGCSVQPCGRSAFAQGLRIVRPRQFTPQVPAAGQLAEEHVRRDAGEVKPENMNLESPLVGLASPVFNDVEIAKVDVEVPTIEIEHRPAVHHLAPFEGTKYATRPAQRLEWSGIDLSSVIDGEVPIAIGSEVATRPGSAEVHRFGVGDLTASGNDGIDELTIHHVHSVPRTRQPPSADPSSCRAADLGDGIWHNGVVPENYFDERIAKSYEEKWPDLYTPEMINPAVAFLLDLAGAGPALELGIGTGRIALPLSQRGVVVHGIELSRAMVEQLQTKAGSEEIGVTIGDFSTARVKGTFTLAYLIRNTITNLTSQEQQVACFRNVAAHLEPGGCFVIEVYVPELRRLPPGETVHAFTVTPAHLGFEEYDVATQIAHSHHYWVVDGQLETFSAPFRYVWPSELDLMAQIAGMRLRERWSDWDRAPFTSESRGHVSVWEKV